MVKTTSVQYFVLSEHKQSRHFSAFRVLFSPVVWSAGGSEKSQFVGDEMRWTVTTDAWSDHHWQPSYVGSQALEVRVCIVDVFLWQLFPRGLQGDFQLAVILNFGSSLWYVSMAPQTW